MSSADTLLGATIIGVNTEAVIDYFAAGYGNSLSVAKRVVVNMEAQFSWQPEQMAGLCGHGSRKEEVGDSECIPC